MMEDNMKKIKSNYKMLIFMIIYFVLTLIMPIFSQMTNAYLTMMIILLIFFMILSANPNRYLLFIILLSGVLFLDILNSVVNSPLKTPLLIYGKLLWLLPPLIGFFLIKNNNIDTIKVIVYFIIGGLLITAITSSYALINDPMAARISATISDSNDSYAIYLNMKNIGGFFIVYQTVIIYPMVIALFKYKLINFSTTLIISFVFGTYVLMTQYAMATILFFSNLIILLLFTKRLKGKQILMIGITVFILFILLKPSTAHLLYYLSNNMESIVLSNRFQYLADSLIGVNTTTNDVGNRILLYNSSIDTFKKHPVIGSWLFNDGSIIGGHSFILDTMGKYGIIGISLLLAFYRQIVINFYKPFENQPFYGYMIYSFLLSIILSFLNPIDSLFSITLVVPLIGILIKKTLLTKRV